MQLTPFGWVIITLVAVFIGLALWIRVGRVRHRRFLVEREAALRRVRERQDAVLYGKPRVATRSSND